MKSLCKACNVPFQLTRRSKPGECSGCRKVRLSGEPLRLRLLKSAQNRRAYLVRRARAQALSPEEREAEAERKRALQKAWRQRRKLTPGGEGEKLALAAGEG